MKQTQCLQIRRDFPPAAGKTYSRIPFEVYPDTEYISLTGSYRGGAGDQCAIDIGVADADGRIRGWSGNLNRMQQIFIGEEQASLGYLAGPLQTGQWEILLGDSREHSQSIIVELELELRARQARIVRGDIHGHSLYSDGAHSIEDKLRMARESRLDFLGFTDHNSVSQNLCLPCNPDVLLLPSCEITTYRGHVNIFGRLPQRIPNFMCTSSEEVRDLLQGLKQQNCIDSELWIQLNHPVRQGDIAGCQWNWSYDMPFDWIEVWNGAWNRNNVANTQIWQSLLQQGRRLPAVGNSDFHSAETKRHGYPCNNVWVNGKTRCEILGALSQGHNYITAEPLASRSFAACCRIVEVDAETGGRFMPFGSRWSLQQGDLQLELTVAADYLAELQPLLLRCWNERGLALEQELSPADFEAWAGGRDGALEHDCRFVLPLNAVARPTAEHAFLRFELFQHTLCDKGFLREEALLLSNPIFFY